ncbi:MAG: hypothetical protein BMS9Abin13_444 [Patescibacteria group bacterium]|nr:MAG: hypothetical protein BMS9Abin13_444 [Patescibacteria group bacterium]
MIEKIITSIENALRGLRQAYHFDRSFRMEVAGAAGFTAVAWLLWPLSGIEIILLAVAYGLIFITELFNTALEQLLLRVHPEEHELIGMSKNTASAAVLLAFIVATVIVTVLLLAHFRIVPIL